MKFHDYFLCDRCGVVEQPYVIFEKKRLFRPSSFLHICKSCYEYMTLTDRLDTYDDCFTAIALDLKLNEIPF